MITERLLLRPVEPSDVDELWAMHSAPETIRAAVEPPHRDIGVSRHWIERVREKWDLDGLSYWLAASRETGRALGVGGVQRQVTGNWNLFYRFGPWAWGQGLATELGAAAVAAAHAHDDSVPVIAWIRADNPASQAVARHLGLADRGEYHDPTDGELRHAWTDRPFAG